MTTATQHATAIQALAKLTEAERAALAAWISDSIRRRFTPALVAAKLAKLQRQNVAEG